MAGPAGGKPNLRLLAGVALLAKAGDATARVSFIVTYVVANVFLSLSGPLVVGIVTPNAAP